MNRACPVCMTDLLQKDVKPIPAENYPHNPMVIGMAYFCSLDCREEFFDEKD